MENSEPIKTEWSQRPFTPEEKKLIEEERAREIELRALLRGAKTLTLTKWRFNSNAELIEWLKANRDRTLLFSDGEIVHEWRNFRGDVWGPGIFQINEPGEKEATLQFAPKSEAIEK